VAERNWQIMHQGYSQSPTNKIRLTTLGGIIEIIRERIWEKDFRERIRNLKLAS